jgi:hypothetical protein
MNRFEYIVVEKYGENMYLGGMDNLEVQWVDEGKKFRIGEYDGSEGLEVFEETNWFTA